MQTPKFQPMVRTAAALALALAGSFSAVPALAESGTGTPTPAPSYAVPTPSAEPTAQVAAPSADFLGTSPAPGATPSGDGLAEAVQRDLGMTMTEFDAAGALATQAAGAVPSLRGLPGYVGMRLDGGTIVVEGSGARLQARVDELNRTDEKGADEKNQARLKAGTAAFVLAAPAVAAPSATAPAGTAPAGTAPSAELLASSAQQLFEAYVRDVGAAGLQAVTYANGHFTIRTGGTTTAQSDPSQSDPARSVSGSGPASGELGAAAAGMPGAKPKMSPADFVARYANVVLEQGARITTEQDLFGGEGYITEGPDGRALCSAGFGAFSPAGEPLVLTAGHCADDGAVTQTEVEALASAAAAKGTNSGATAGALGTFGFSQFGGAGNSKVAPDGTNVGTDIAVLQGIRSGLDLQPAVTRWDLPADPGPTSVKIVGTVAPFQGQPVCRSGRTTGWRCGTVDSVGIWAIPGPNSVPPNFDNDLRAIQAFDSTSVTSSGGDSGGPWISGNFAVGTHTGAEYEPRGEGRVQIRAIATTLVDAAARIPGGVQLQLFLNKPELTAPGNGTVTAGGPITGRVAAEPASVVAPHSRVRITVLGNGSGQKSGQPAEVPVDASGNWSFAAPAAAGPFRFSAETVNGFSRSGATAMSVQLSRLAAPVITAPAEGRRLTTIQTIEGTGEAGRTVRLSGDFTGTGVVAADGRWSIGVSGQPAFGDVSVTAVLTAPGQADSPSVTNRYTVLPPAPAVSSIRDGQHLRQDALPASISGTAVDGAEVTVSVDGKVIGSATARSGGAPWSVPFPDGLAVGAHMLSVTQATDNVTSPPAVLAFTIDAAPASAGAPEESPAPGQPTEPSQPAANQPPTSVAEGPGAPGAPNEPSNPPAPVPPSDTPVKVGGTAPGRGGQLASTGTGGLLTAAGLGAGALLLGAAFLAFSRRRKVS
ncbi:trypsin-like serine protease [Arthrobacter sp. NPDC058192]|uniref:trypsin-like serine protease n=1 Tax=Arthrobacter sp. NPDC058192 TaxID=3346372 RepID=UPI0036EECE4E